MNEPPQQLESSCSSKPQGGLRSFYFLSFYFWVKQPEAGISVGGYCLLRHSADPDQGPSTCRNFAGPDQRATPPLYEPDRGTSAHRDFAGPDQGVDPGTVCVPGTRCLCWWVNVLPGTATWGCYFPPSGLWRAVAKVFQTKIEYSPLIQQ